MNTKGKGFVNKLNLLTIFYIIFLLIFQPTITSAITYTLSEDFTDGNLDGWDLRWEGWNGWNLTSFDEHGFEFNEGYMESAGGDYNTWAWNLAVHDINMSYGVWEIEANYPFQRTATKFDFYIYLSDSYFGGIPEEDQYNYRWTALKRNGTLISVSQARIDVDIEKTANSGLTNEVPLSITAIPGEWTHYGFVKTPDRFYVTVDKLIVGNFTYDDGVSIYQQFALTSNIGTKMKFDNLKMSLDYEEYMGTVELPASIESNGDADGQNSDKSTTPVLRMVSTLTSLFIVTTYSIKSRKS